MRKLTDAFSYAKVEGRNRFKRAAMLFAIVVSALVGCNPLEGSKDKGANTTPSPRNAGSPDGLATPTLIPELEGSFSLNELLNMGGHIVLPGEGVSGYADKVYQEKRQKNDQLLPAHVSVTIYREGEDGRYRIVGSGDPWSGDPAHQGDVFVARIYQAPSE